MRDGLYRVVSQYFVAGFVISHGKMTQCAPVLRKGINFWKTKAIRVDA